MDACISPVGIAWEDVAIGGLDGAPEFSWRTWKMTKRKQTASAKAAVPIRFLEMQGMLIAEFNHIYPMSTFFPTAF